MKLSLLICSLERRKIFLDRLSSILKPQVTDDVEVLVSIDNGEIPIGKKRNTLLQGSKGEYIAFIDDDDIVTEDYVSLVLDAIKTSPDVVGIHLLMTIDGILRGKTYHSLKYSTWYDEPIPGDKMVKNYYRNPNHLNPVKREYAVKVGFPETSMGEDRKYSFDLHPLLKTEVYIEKPIYTYEVRSVKVV